VKAIAEEMSSEGLRAAQSVCKQVATSLSLSHRLCDPTSDEQRALGIAEPSKTHPPGGIDPEVAAADRIRESCWLQCVLELDTWPVLFVCGGDHPGSFRRLLETNGIVVEVLHERWKRPEDWL